MLENSCKKALLTSFGLSQMDSGCWLARDTAGAKTGPEWVLKDWRFWFGGGGRLFAKWASKLEGSCVQDKKPSCSSAAAWRSKLSRATSG